MPLTCRSIRCESTPEKPRCTVAWVCPISICNVLAPFAVWSLAMAGCVVSCIALIEGSGSLASIAAVGGIGAFITSSINYISRQFERVEDKEDVAAAKHAATTAAEKASALAETVTAVATDVKVTKLAAKVAVQQNEELIGQSAKIEGIVNGKTEAEKEAIRQASYAQGHADAMAKVGVPPVPVVTAMPGKIKESE